MTYWCVPCTFVAIDDALLSVDYGEYKETFLHRAAQTKSADEVKTVLSLLPRQIAGKLSIIQGELC
jgi:hypothetical protein